MAGMGIGEAMLLETALGGAEAAAALGGAEAAAALGGAEAATGLGLLGGAEAAAGLGLLSEAGAAGATGATGIGALGPGVAEGIATHSLAPTIVSPGFQSAGIEALSGAATPATSFPVSSSSLLSSSTLPPLPPDPGVSAGIQTLNAPATRSLSMVPPPPGTAATPPLPGASTSFSPNYSLASQTPAPFTPNYSLASQAAATGPKIGIGAGTEAAVKAPGFFDNPISWFKNLSDREKLLYGGAAGYGLPMLLAGKQKVPGQTPYTGPLSYFRYDPAFYKPAYASGGIADLGSYSDGGRLLKGPGDGMSDDIPATIADKRPARLADGEFVVSSDVVSGLGNGSTDKGAEQLYNMMDRVRQARTGTKKQGRRINPEKFVPA